eukprot:UN4516
MRDIIGIPWNEVVLWGRSIGSGPTVHLASKTAVRAMVLQSPLLSIYRIAFSFSLPGDMFHNVDKIGKACCPIYVMHGTNDEIIHYSHAEELVRSAKKGVAWPAYIVQNGGHNNLEIIARRSFFDNLAKFLEWLENGDISDELREQAEEAVL